MTDEQDQACDAATLFACYDAQKDWGVESSRLIDLCDQAGIGITDSVARKLTLYLALMLKKNEVLNLTAIREWDKALVLHLVDSLTLLQEFDAQPRGIQEKRFLDMGCGAGLPGIPLAIARGSRKGLLCDSVKKKITAVDEFIHTLNLDGQLTTSTERLETLGTNQRRAFGCIVARAVAPLAVLVEYAAPLLAKNGQLIVSKGMPSLEEYEQGVAASKVCGLDIVSRRTFELPFEHGKRTIIVCSKVAEPLVSLPRAIGVAGKQPLS